MKQKRSASAIEEELEVALMRFCDGAFKHKSGPSCKSRDSPNERRDGGTPEEFSAAGLIVPVPSFIPPMPLRGVATW